MNNTQLYLTIGIPSFVALFSWVTVILAWLSNRSDINRINDKLDKQGDALWGGIDKIGDGLRSEMRELRAEMSRRFDAVDAELRYFHGSIGKLDARVEALEKRT